MKCSDDAAAWERAVRQAVSSLRYGSVEVQVHDGRVVQLETRTKVRFADERRPEDRRRHDNENAKPHRTPGGAAPREEESKR
jgi:hypothetical protein